jgi:hypothetical protein
VVNGLIPEGFHLISEAMLPMFREEHPHEAVSPRIVEKLICASCAARCISGPVVAAALSLNNAEPEFLPTVGMVVLPFVKGLFDAHEILRFRR